MFLWSCFILVFFWRLDSYTRGGGTADTEIKVPPPWWKSRAIKGSLYLPWSGPARTSDLLRLANVCLPSSFHFTPQNSKTSEYIK